MASELDGEMCELLTFAAQSEDHAIVLDLRKLGNRGRSETFSPFFEAARKLLEAEGFIAVSERRHGEIPHLAAIIGGAQGAAGHKKGENTNGCAPPFISIRNLKDRVNFSHKDPQSHLSQLWLLHFAHQTQH